jgi:hypothetical protein
VKVAASRCYDNMKVSYSGHGYRFEIPDANVCFCSKNKCNGDGTMVTPIRAPLDVRTDATFADADSRSDRMVAPKNAPNQALVKRRFKAIPMDQEIPEGYHLATWEEIKQYKTQIKSFFGVYGRFQIKDGCFDNSGYELNGGYKLITCEADRRLKEKIIISEPENGEVRLAAGGEYHGQADIVKSNITN